MTFVPALLVAAALAAQAEPTPLEGKRFAVLEMSDSSGHPDQVLLDNLAVLVRGALTATVSPFGAVVYTRENMLELVKVTGGECREGECEVETARNLNADYFVSGALALIDGTYALSLGLHETRSGVQRFFVSVEAPSVAELRKAVAPKTRILVSGAFHLGTPQRVTVNPQLPQDDVVLAEFTSLPDGAAVKVDGVMLCSATPCKKPVAPGMHVVTFSHVEHDDVEITAELGDARRQVTVTLPPSFGTLTVTARPEGLTFLLDGRPYEAAQLRELHVVPGEHELAVSSPCFEPAPQPLLVPKGQHRALEVRAEARKAWLRVNAADPRGNAVEGALVVEGREVGQTWKSATLPLCTRSVQVRTLYGEFFELPVSLVERELVTVSVKVPDLLTDPLTDVPPGLRATKRREAWERRTAPQRSKATAFTAGAVASGLATGALGYLWFTGSSERDAAATAYGKATGDFPALYAAYSRAYWKPALAGPAALVGVAGTAFLGWKALQAWREVPALPVFTTDGTSVGVAVGGTLP